MRRALRPEVVERLAVGVGLLAPGIEVPYGVAFHGVAYPRDAQASAGRGSCDLVAPGLDRRGRGEEQLLVLAAKQREPLGRSRKPVGNAA